MVTIYPTFESTCHTYYLRGLSELVSGRQLRYGTCGFPKLYRVCFAFISRRVSGVSPSHRVAYRYGSAEQNDIRHSEPEDRGSGA